MAADIEAPAVEQSVAELYIQAELLPPPPELHCIPATSTGGPPTLPAVADTSSSKSAPADLPAATDLKPPPADLPATDSS